MDIPQRRGYVAVRYRKFPWIEQMLRQFDSRRLKEPVARSVLWVARVIGTPGLRVARSVLPLSAKRVLSRFVTNFAGEDAGIVTAGDGHRFRAIAEPVFLHIRMEGYYEKALSDIVRRIVQPGDTVVDIGANFGWYSIVLASRVGPGGKVCSFEPNRTVFEILKENIALNNYGDRVDARCMGIGARRSKARLSAGDSESAVGYVVENVEEAGDLQEIEIRPLDEVLENKVGNIAYAKIDVEGFEPKVMEGGKNVFFSEDPPVIQLEFNVDAIHRQGIDIKEYAEKLHSLEADIYVVSGGRVEKIEKINYLQNADLFFFPRKGKFSNRFSLV